VHLAVAQRSRAARHLKSGTPSQYRRSLDPPLFNRVLSLSRLPLLVFKWRRRLPSTDHTFLQSTFSGIRLKRSRFSAFDSSDEKGLTLEVCLFTGTSRVQELFQSDENNLPITFIFNLKFNYPS
jgi:hypothetical protein